MAENTIELDSTTGELTISMENGSQIDITDGSIEVQGIYTEVDYGEAFDDKREEMKEEIKNDMLSRESVEKFVLFGNKALWQDEH